MLKLNSTFFSRPTEVVAQELIGKSFIINGQKGIITETEAYKGLQDPASHAFKGPTPRAKIMFGPSARLYIYLIYGMYHCLNIVAHEETEAGAVLIRGLALEEVYLNGPGKICQYFQMDRTLNHHNINESETIYIEENGIPTSSQATARIGIKKGTDKLWRFIRN